MDQNDYQIFLLKALGGGLVAFIALAQLGSAIRFGSGGPRALGPLSITASVIAAVLFGLSYGNLTFTTLQLKARLARPEGDPTRISEYQRVPADIRPRVRGAQTEMTVGVLIGLGALVFYLLGVWWPASASTCRRHHRPPAASCARHHCDQLTCGGPSGRTRP